MAIADGNGLPIAVGIASASPHEVTLARETIENRFIEETPERIIADKAYDSDPLDENLEKSYGIELIAPHKENRKKPATRVEDPYADTEEDGRLSGCLRGSRTFVDLFAATNIIQAIFSE